jgi:hypothetical protein
MNMNNVIALVLTAVVAFVFSVTLGAGPAFASGHVLLVKSSSSGHTTGGGITAPSAGQAPGSGQGNQPQSRKSCFSKIYHGARAQGHDEILASQEAALICGHN